MNKIKIIAARECRLTLTSWPFWLITLGLPLLMGAIGLIVFATGILAGRSLGSSEPEGPPPVLGIVDHGPFLDWEALNLDENPEPQVAEEVRVILDNFSLPVKTRKQMEGWLAAAPRSTRPLDYKVYPDIETARTALSNGKIRALLELPADFAQSFQATLTAPDEDSSVSMSMTQADLRRKLFAQSFPEEQYELFLEPLSQMTITYLKENPKKEAGLDIQKELTRFSMPVIFIMIFMLVIATSSDRLLRGLVEEKTNRVIEILLSSTTADQLMAGKVIGLGLVGLIQLSIWMMICLLPASFLLVFLDINFAAFAVFIIFFLLGYFQLGSLMLGLGSLGKNLQEANQWSAVLLILSILPAMMMPFLLDNPDGLPARLLTWFPLTGSLLVVLRFASDAISLLEMTGAGLFLLAANILAIKISARVFRIGILMTGKTPNPIELWRALKHS